MRLDRLLSNSGYGSRTAVKTLIRSRKVEISGTIVTDASFHVNEHNLPEIKINGVLINASKFLHYILNKPEGFITALKDAKHPTVADFFPENILLTGIFPVGRLDIDTTGLLIFTNDGTLCHRLAGPRWNIKKIYYFELEGKYLDESDVRALADGIIIGENTLCKPAELEILSSASGLLTIVEGKYHQVKKMMKALGGTVVRLERRVVGPLSLPVDLLPGQIRQIDEKQVKALYDCVHLTMP